LFHRPSILHQDVESASTIGLMSRPNDRRLAETKNEGKGGPEKTSLLPQASIYIAKPRPKIRPEQYGAFFYLFKGVNGARITILIQKKVGGDFVRTLPNTLYGKQPI
jgi:hypothetical protein